MTQRCSILFGFTLLISSLSAMAACPDEAALASYLAEFRNARSSKGFGSEITLDDAACARARLIRLLPAGSGPLLGYKAVFTNPDSQRRFGVNEPGWGAMFAGMMLPDGARVAANFGAKPRYEADFIVVVKDAGLADADTPLQAMEHITALIPFIELPDLMLDGAMTGAELLATNAAFRGGVLGSPIRVDQQQAEGLALALENMEVIVREETSGREIGREKGKVLMNHPLNAALWLARALRRDGIELRSGDLLSLGGFLASRPVQAGTQISVRYLGLPGDPIVRVGFD